MPTADIWPSIIGAVKNPITLAALTVLVLMVILRLALSKVPVLRQRDGYRALRYVVTVVGLLALVVVLGALGIALVQAKREASRAQLGRLEFESILQKHRGGIERCMQPGQSALFLDFAVRYQSDEGFDIDIYPGEAVDEQRLLAEKTGVFDASLTREVTCSFPAKGGEQSEDLYFVSSAIGFHPAAVTIGRRAAKLSVVAPDRNRCILDLLAPELTRFRLEEQQLFAHRLITDKGVTLSR